MFYFWPLTIKNIQQNINADFLHTLGVWILALNGLDPYNHTIARRTITLKDYSSKYCKVFEKGLVVVQAYRWLCLESD
jgi:hypothetical protein